MLHLPLLLANLGRRKLRTGLTVLTIAAAMFLFGLLAVIDLAFTAGLDAAGADRLVVIGRNGVIQPLPEKYQRQLAGMEGVADVCNCTWFGGVYQDERNFFPQIAIEDEAYLRLYPEVVVTPEARATFLADRQGAIVGRATAARFGWKVGDRIPIRGTIFPGTFEFNISGIYQGRRPSDDETGFLFRPAYLRESAPDYWKGLVGWYVVQVKEPAQADRIAKAIDERFSNSSAETKTQPEKAFIAAWINQMGNIRLLILGVGGMVLFTLMLVTGNTMAGAVRERTGEIAVLKTIGFSDGSILRLVLAESLAIALAGGFLGLGLAKLMTLGANPIPGVLPIFHLADERVLQGLALSVLLGLAAGVMPGWLAMRLRIVDALRRV